MYKGVSRVWLLVSAIVFVGLAGCRNAVDYQIRADETVHERLILPEGFEGTIFVFYDTGESTRAPPEAAQRTVDYLIDSSGIYSSPYSQPNAIRIQVSLFYSTPNRPMEFIAGLGSCHIDDPSPKDPTILCAEGILGSAQNLRTYTVSKYTNKLAARSESFRKKIAFADSIRKK